MAIRAQGNRILFAVVAQMAPCLDVMDLQVRLTSSTLASPPVAPQDLLSERPIGLVRKAFPAVPGRARLMALHLRAEETALFVRWSATVVVGERQDVWTAFLQIGCQPGNPRKSFREINLGTPSHNAGPPSRRLRRPSQHTGGNPVLFGQRQNAVHVLSSCLAVGDCILFRFECRSLGELLVINDGKGKRRP